jgi:hypothetical protein
MALNRRDFLISAPILTTALFSCSSGQSVGKRPFYSEIASINASKPGAKTIIVFMPHTQQTMDVWLGLTDELERDFCLVAVKLESAFDVPIIEQAMARYHPDGLVLMNNPTVQAYRDFQALHQGIKFPPAVIVMTSFLESQANQVTNATGISYEVPLVMLITDLRKLIALPTGRVGVISRTSLLWFVNRQIELARREQVPVSVEQVGPLPRPADIRLALRRLKRSVDVIWILNDNQLLTPKLISKGWLPGLDERPWVPTIVGAASLVSPQHSFGTFAVLPDHVALGAQAASLVLDIADDDWVIGAKRAVQLSRSNKTTIDIGQIRERFALRQHALDQVDNVLE